MEKIKNLFSHGRLRVIKWVVFVLLAGYVILVIVRVVQLSNADKTEAQVAKIHAAKLQLSDVMGDNLPPEPGEEADETLAGVDANQNGIRDDVELAIFEAYPDSARARAVLLQYALSLHMEFTQPMMNNIIATEIAREQSRGFECVGEILSRDSETFDDKLDELIKFVEINEFDTGQRKDDRNAFTGKVRSYSSLDRMCDIDLETL